MHWNIPVQWQKKQEVGGGERAFQRNGGVDVALQDRDQKKELTNQSAGSASPQRSSPGCTSWQSPDLVCCQSPPFFQTRKWIRDSGGRDGVREREKKVRKWKVTMSNRGQKTRIGKVWYKTLQRWELNLKSQFLSNKRLV